MFVFITHLTVLSADHAALERLFRERSRLVDGYPGFLYLQLLRPQAGSATHVFLTAWRDRESFRSYMSSPEHDRAHTHDSGEIMKRTGIRHEAYEVLMDSRMEPEWR